MVHLAILLQQNNQALTIQIWLFSLKLIFNAKSEDVKIYQSNHKAKNSISQNPLTLPCSIGGPGIFLKNAKKGGTYFILTRGELRVIYIFS